MIGRFLRFALLAAAIAVVGPFVVRGVNFVGSQLDELGGPEHASRTEARVTSVVDGDTINVRAGGREVPVRMIGIDTPETHRPGVPVECGGPEAAASLGDLLAPGDRVTLIADPSQDRRDRYGRLLRYVELGGKDLAEEQLRRGWAQLYVFGGEPFDRVDRFRRGAADAKRRGVGNWPLCGGDFHSAS